MGSLRFETGRVDLQFVNLRAKRSQGIVGVPFRSGGMIRSASRCLISLRPQAIDPLVDLFPASVEGQQLIHLRGVPVSSDQTLLYEIRVLA